MRSKTLLRAKTPIKQSSGKKPTKPKLRSVAKLKKDADTWFSKATRLRFADKKDGEWWAKCITCDAYKPIKQLQCGHFMSRQYNSTRYDEENCAPQDYGCNVMHQGRQYEFGVALDGLYGAGTAKRMHDQAKIPHQFSREELLEIIKNSRAEVEFYESKN